MAYECTALENIVDEYCKKVGGNERSRILELFRVSAKFKLNFWDSTYSFPKLDQVSKKC
ncbi:hypothetical protein [Wolbachia endosymbiont of Wuchereria bancrofti]|uniref:hypothetical protein n=1 Tax=Wolbachia endosymbiont of Wuchereria bancrofti TaxID=96496 RepID=UPI001FE796B0|nr:hypothetical protein [Wolbachia endosymbiont of Wuchereria bancrofti]